MDKRILIALVCLCLCAVATARVLPRYGGPEYWVTRFNNGGRFSFRGYGKCPIGYVRSPAFTCVKCELYKGITGSYC
ncbi:unnamed protein product, partial [Iphiclides podalirius]